MLGRSLAFAALVPLSFAFSDTVPVVAWSSHRSQALDELPSVSHSYSSHIYEKIFLNDDICDYDAVVMVDQPGLHASDLRALSPLSSLSSLLINSPSSAQIPYMRRSPGSLSVHDLAGLVQHRCRSHMLIFAPGDKGANVEEGSKHVVCLSMPSLESTSGERKNAMAQYESQLAQELENLAVSFPKHLVVMAGSPSLSLSRRQADPASPALVLQQQPGNSTLPEGGILKRYQLLTPGLITCLLVAFFILIPVVLLGISTLAGIQNPHMIPPPPDFDALEKKD
ncbi:hypothetical protein BV25DRAFT_1812039 [Artomyces pyxidatus]|uniref:Uncharacterized protein n=1 Tax=Artomyces pyxidatus TaxID=48021 RepID=A0ACB8SND6_9AGAM|nr:hypothetical protein BV25DRAFT_1812039 [Artomyces pyxidatus]